MKNKELYFSKSELIDQWLEVHPNDAEHPDLEQMALGGYVDCKNGLYIWFPDWEVLQKGEEISQS